MEIQHNQKEKSGTFFIEQDGRQIALLTYRNPTGDVMIIDHTEVDESHRNKGIGGKLVKAAVDYARKNAKKINPVCPFAEAEFDENMGYSDVLK